MLDPANVPPVAADELLARFITQKSQLRADQTLRQDVFIPHPYPELSVTRHREATEAEVWQVGRDVAAAMQKKLYGRGDILCRDCVRLSLWVAATPLLPTNPNHADVIGWPERKEDKKAIAIELAATAGKMVKAP